MRIEKTILAVLTAFLAVAALANSPARADTPVDLELVLAVDVSGSMDHDEARLQRDGYLGALTDPRVTRVIEAGFKGAIAVTYIEWAGLDYKTVIADWALIKDAASARSFAAEIDKAPVTTGMWTSISGVVEFALPRFEGNGFEGARRVIDVSGDGANNDGHLVTVARDKAVAARITVNGLPIVNDRINPFGWPQIPDLDLYYRHCVIGGPGAFLVVAEGFGAFAEAIRRKLIFEIAGRTPADGSVIVRAPSRPAPLPRLRKARWLIDGGRNGLPLPGPIRRVARQPPPCDIGERRLEERRRMWDDL